MEKREQQQKEHESSLASKEMDLLRRLYKNAASDQNFSSCGSLQPKDTYLSSTNQGEDTRLTQNSRGGVVDHTNYLMNYND